ncbi:hypothetical protein GEMRC1_007864 [Eukaryota sp. GEM-RC1]
MFAASVVFNAALPSIVRHLLSPLASFLVPLFIKSFLIDNVYIEAYSRTCLFLDPIKCFFSVLIVILTSKVAHFLSKKDHVSISLVCHLAYVLSFILSFLLISIAPFLVHRVLYSSELIHVGKIFFYLRIFSMAFSLFLSTTVGILQGFSDFKAVLFVQVLSSFSWILLSFLGVSLLHSKLGFIGLSQLIGVIVALVIGVRFVIKHFGLYGLVLSSQNPQILLSVFTKNSFHLIMKSSLIDLLYLSNGLLLSKDSPNVFIVYQLFLNFWVFICNYVDGIASVFISMTASQFQFSSFTTCSLTISKYSTIFGFPLILLLNFFIASTVQTESFLFVLILSIIFTIGLYINCLSFFAEAVLFGSQEFKRPWLNLLMGLLMFHVPSFLISRFVLLSLFENWIVHCLFVDLILINYWRYLTNVKDLQLLTSKHEGLIADQDVDDVSDSFS